MQLNLVVMNKLTLPIFIIIALFLSPYSNCQEIQKLTSSDISPAVYGVLEIPQEPGPHPSVLILHGYSGCFPDHFSIAKTLADSGFVALTIDYYTETKMPINFNNDPEVRRATVPQWQKTIHNAVSFLKSNPYSLNQPVGIIGFSQGAILAISVATAIPELAAVVDYYGRGIIESFESKSLNFPPLLILHGEADSVVSVNYAYELKGLVESNCGNVEMHLYPETGHGFNIKENSNFSEVESSHSLSMTIAFLRKWLLKDENNK